MQKLVLISCLIFLVACKQDLNQPFVAATPTDAAQINNSAVLDAFKNKKSDVFVEGSGVVKKLLPDDNKGARHQKFLLTISPEQILLFAHNIDLAPRVADLQVGDDISFRGEYVYNPKGGVVHWTHKAPQGDHAEGWIKHNGKTFQ